MFFDIFLDILHKMKENLGQEHAKGGPLFFHGKNWNNFPCYPWKMTVFPVLTLLFHPSLPKIWLSHLNKNYIFEVSGNRAGSLQKFHNVILKTVNLGAI